MLLFAYYLLKVIICSGILYGYYLLALRNKVFHRWNRFYLLSAIILSLVVPLIKINIFQNTGSSTQVVQLLQVVSTGDEFIYEYTRNGGFHIDATNLSVFIYIVVSFYLLAFLIQTLLKIAKLKKNNNQTIVEGVNFINTKAEGTPFSFFNDIFWNDKIDINSATGKQIFKHEVAHVQEKHSYDKIFINIVLIFFWCNPFFWLIRKELNIIHEFIADKKALEDSDTAAFAAMILQATYPQQQFTLTNNFFYSPLKRRLAMLTKNKNPKMNYISRVLVLPIVLLVFLAFTLKAKTFNTFSEYQGKAITVIIDAGHGGDDKGASADNIYEKDLAFSIAKEIKELNKNENINIILSREEDSYINPKDRVKFSAVNKADLFISIHIAAAINNNTLSGLNILIPKNDNPYIKESKILGSSLIESFKNNYPLPVENDLKQRANSVWILKANEYPAVIIETGFLTTKKDLEYLIKPDNQKIIARNILNGIEKYALRKPINSNKISDNERKEVANSLEIKNNEIISSKTDTVPNSNTVIVKTVTTNQHNNTDSSFKSFKQSGKDLIIKKLRTTALPDLFAINAEEFTVVDRKNNNKSRNEIGLIIINGKAVDKKSLEGKLVHAKSGKVYPANDDEAIKLYGEAARNGVIIFTDASISDDHTKIITNAIPKDNDKVFTKVEVDPSFPGGDMAWARYIKKIIEGNISELTSDNKSGTCRVKFIVDIDGSVRDVKVLSMQGTKLAEVTMNAIKNGPKWIPAKQKDQVVAAYREQPITFTIAPN